MNRKPRTLRLRDYLAGPDAWGRAEGREVFAKLIAAVERDSSTMVFAISMTGVRRTDISFASESVVELARRFRCNKGFCLVNLMDEDLLDNWEAAAVRKEQPLTVWDNGKARIIGAEPSRGNAEVLAYALTQDRLTAAQVASKLDLQLTNASTKLKQLWEQGFLLRQEEVQETGGREFYYFRIR